MQAILTAHRCNRFYRNGIDTEFTTAIELREELEQPLLEQVYQGHCELMKKESLSPMVDIQLVKDAAMTSALLEADTDMSVLVAGTGHTRIDSAIPRHLQLNGDDTVMSVALVEVNPELPSVTDYEVADRFRCADLHTSCQSARLLRRS